MKPIILFSVVFVILGTSGNGADFPTNSAANRVLLTEDFVSRGTSNGTNETTDVPSGIAIDPETGKLFVASIFDNRILRFADIDSLNDGSPAEAVIGQTSFAGTGPATSQTRLSYPDGLCFDSSGNLWVADTENHRVLRFPGAASVASGMASANLVLGQETFDANVSGDGADKMFEPTGVFIDGGGNLWVADRRNDRVLKFLDASSLSNGDDADIVVGWPDFSTPSSGSEANRFTRPVSVFVDGGDRLWVADEINSRVLQFDGASTVTSSSSAVRVFGQDGFGTDSPGLASDRMHYPNSIVVDANGHLYVTDNTNDRLLVFRNAAGKASGAPADRVLGAPNFTTNNPSSLTTSQTLSRPRGVTMDPDGNLWVVDYNRVLRYSSVPDAPQDAINPVLSLSKRPPKRTSKSAVKISGVASDAGGIKEVRYQVGKGALLPAAGTTSWSFKAKLQKGKANTIQIYAEDFAGNRSTISTLRIKSTK
jgi:sugar lactone lactonase YvrE